MKSKRLNLRLIGQFAVYIMMSRVAFMGIHPVAISAFAIVYAEKRHRNPMILAIMIGVVSIALPMEALLGGGDVIKYILIYICIITIDRLAINRKIYMGNQSLTCLAALVTAIVGVCGGIMNIGESLFLSVGEGILVIVIANLLYKGLHLLEYGKVGQVLSNEQLISFVLVLVLAITGIPNPAPSLISLSEGGLYMLVIFMAYKHGASAGAIAGAGAGIAASIHGQSPAFIGMYCLM